MRRLAEQALGMVYVTYIKNKSNIKNPRIRKKYRDTGRMNKE